MPELNFKISGKKLKQLKRIAESKGKSLEYCLQEAIRQYVVLENSTTEAMQIAGVIL